MSKRNATDPRGWHGAVAILPGIAVFSGQAGGNSKHRHWAHQLSIGLGAKVEVTGETKLFAGDALFIPANRFHRLSPGRVLSVYVDPQTLSAKSLSANLDVGGGIATVPRALAQLVRGCFLGKADLQQGAVAFQRAMGNPERPAESGRSAVVMQALEGVLTQGADVNRGALAQLTGLSPSRFSHWFREEMGMPLRSYLKWLRLKYGVTAILRGESLSAAAFDARFADQAHFSRTFRAAFGISPALALSAIRSGTGMGLEDMGSESNR